MNQNLPFPRGETYFDGDTDRATSTGTNHIVGQMFTIRDNKDATNNGTWVEKTLVVVRNGSTGNLNQGRGIRFATGATKTTFRVAKGYVNAQGEFGLSIDDAYSASYNIVPNDLFYAVVAGPNRDKTATDATSTSITAGTLATWDATGRLEAAAANDYVHGRFDATTTATNTAVLVHVSARYGSNF